MMIEAEALVMRLQKKTLELFADYYQFYLWDGGVKPQAPEDYTDDDTRHRIKAGPNVLAILAERNMKVAVEVEIHNTAPAYDADDWDHIVEASLHLPTGKLHVEECSGGVIADFDVEPGWYRVRSFHGGLDTIDESGLEGDDHYLAVLWPGSPVELRIIKQWIHERPG
jgi:hypothetical protein